MQKTSVMSKSTLYLHQLITLLCLFVFSFTYAQDMVRKDAVTPTTVRYANRDIVTLQATILDVPPSIRSQRIIDRLDALPSTQLNDPLTVSPLSYRGKECAIIELHGKLLVTLCSDDLEIGSPPIAQVAMQVKKNLHGALQARYEQSSLKRMAWAVILSILASAILATLIWLLSRTRKHIYQRLDQQIEKNSHLPAISWRNMLLRAEYFAVRVTGWICTLFMVYSWLAFVLLRFPYTKNWGEQLGNSILNLGNRVLDSVLSAVPGLIHVAVIFVITRMVIRVSNLLFDSVQQGYTNLPGLHAETVGATKRLTHVMLWVFALILAYPYLPGANSDAFKGVSVFLGLMLTLGSAGIVNQAMSGLVLIYSRALKVGDRIQIGDAEGIVIEQGALSTKIRNRHQQELTLPNSVIVSGKIINKTRLSRQSGEAIITSITIGYDTPWRQVHAMLELAVHRTPELRQDETPKICQLALQDFYVQYEIRAHLISPLEPVAVRSKLHAAIQDVFNEFGIQIMSPNFVAQPNKNIISAPEEWYAPPAKAKNKETPP